MQLRIICGASAAAQIRDIGVYRADGRTVTRIALYRNTKDAQGFSAALPGDS